MARCSRSSRMSNGTSMRRRTVGLTLSSVILRRAMVAALMPPLYDAPSRRPSATAATDRALIADQRQPSSVQCRAPDPAAVQQFLVLAKNLGGPADPERHSPRR